MRTAFLTIGVLVACGFLLAMCAEGFAQEFRPYGIDGNLTKQSWCK